MKYREAFAIGSVCEGTIQCTYATIFDANGNGLFSLQHNKTMRSYKYLPDGGVLINEITPDVFFESQYGDTYAGRRDTDLNGGITIDLPMVYITEISDDTLVPAHLTEDALSVIGKAIEKMKIYKHTIYLVADYDTSEMKKGERKIVKETSQTPDIKAWNNNITDHRYHYELESEYVVTPKYQKLLEVLLKRETVYIRPAAFDWIPTDGTNAVIVDADGKEIKLTDALAAAEKKVARAKALLAMAGASIIL